MVTDNFVNGRPRHHLPSAQSVEFDPNGSMFFIVEYADFIEMPIETIQNIFHHRHIVIDNVPVRNSKWSLENLSTLGSLTQMREIQGMYLTYTLQPMFDHSLKP